MEGNGLDASGNGRTDTLKGSNSTYVAGALGQGISLPGTDTNFVKLGDVALTDGATKATWVIRFNEPTIRANGVLFSSWSDNNSHLIVRKVNTTIPAFYVFVAASPRDAGHNWGISNTASYVANSWNCLAVVYDGTQPTNATRLRIYLNASELGFASFEGTIPASLTTVTTNTWECGHWEQGATGYSFNGKLDEFTAWNGKALSVRDIQEVAMGLAPLE